MTLVNRDVPSRGRQFLELINREQEEHSVAVIGDEPEALLLAVLYAEAGIPNYLVGSFRDERGRAADRSGIEEALWLLGIHRRSGRISLESDPTSIPLSRIKTLIFAAHPTNTRHTSLLEMTVRKIAPRLSTGIQVIFTGVCRPRYTSSVIKTIIEKQSGLSVGKDLSLSYVPVHWTGEKLEEFREKPKIIAGYEQEQLTSFQEHLLSIFPAVTKAPTIELAEAAGLFSVISQEVTNALRLDLAKMSEKFGLDYEEVLGLCNITATDLDGHMTCLPERETIGTTIAIQNSARGDGSRIVRAAHRVNENYQSQVMDMIRRALDHCGQGLRRSRIAILGTDGMVESPWRRAESPKIIETLQKRGVRVSLYPGETQTDTWIRLVGDHARIESNLLKAVAKATCTVVALPKSAALELDPNRLALEMDRPGAICDLSRVLEASNVERAGLFYTSIGRGTLNT